MTDDCYQQIERAMLGDQFRLRQQWQKMEKLATQGKPVDQMRAAWTTRIEQSIALRDLRETQQPTPTFSDALPINAKRDEIAAIIRDHQVTVVCGETGSGKSTQIPKLCLSLGRGLSGYIGHTQPRRIAARSVAARIAEELGSSVGQAVGFKVRFDDQVSDETYIKLMTDGILLAETRSDRFLEKYDTLIIDEAHERSLNIDFLLGYIKQLLPRRSDLRLIITSATIDAERFADYFAIGGKPAPIVEVSGRGYPVETRYRPSLEEQANEEVAQQQVMRAALDEVCDEGAGDALIFLPTERDIRATAKLIRGWSVQRREPIDVLPLYARLPLKEQQRIFKSSSRRRVVLATNVAESSLTVPNIRFVIDVGTARLSRYAPRSKVQRLPIERISQASAKQREGRCGRIGPGICIRLYSEDDFQRRAPFTTPEIRRTNLASVILQMTSLRLGDVNKFPFLDPPHKDAIRDGYATLFELNAIDEQRRLTELGRRMSRLPVDPRIARMILAGDDEHCLTEILIIAAGIEAQDVRLRPAGKEQAADEQHRAFTHPESDFLTYLKLWDWYQEAKQRHSRSKLQRVCQQHYLSSNRFREWQDVHRQLKQIVLASGLRLQPRRDKYAAIHRALLSGLLSNMGIRSDRHAYRSSGEMTTFLWPGSGVFQKKPKWVMAAEVIETNKRYLRTVARIEPEWADRLAGHLVKRSYRKPHWSRKAAMVLALERVTLFGLPIIPKRRTNYGPVDTAAARGLFIQHALVEGDFDYRGAFFRHNQNLIQQLTSIAAKTRDRRYLIAHADLFEFYHTRLPDHVCDEMSLRKWWKKAAPERKQACFLKQSDLINDEPDVAPTLFPPSIRAGAIELDAEYAFTPGETHDGVNVTVPVEALSQVDQRQLDWVVPGLLHEKLVAMIRSLPKSIRTSLIPAPDVASRAVEQIPFGKGAFLTTVCKVLSDLAGEPIPPSAFQLEKLPQHLRVLIRVVDPSGKELATGRSVAQLQTQLNIRTAPESTFLTDERFEKDNLRTWDFGDLPEQVEYQRNGCYLLGFPMLVDQETSVSLRIHANQSFAEQNTRNGLRRLFLLAEFRDIDDHVDWLPRLNELLQWSISLAHQRSFRGQLCELLAQRAFLHDQPIPRSADQFAAACDTGRQQLSYAVQDVAKLVVPMMETYQQVAVALQDFHDVRTNPVLSDLRTQVAELLTEGFLVTTPWRWLEQFPRYLQAILVRLERLRTGGGARDAKGMRELTPRLTQYAEQAAANDARGSVDEHLEIYRWMLEEYRVSLFAQQLGTSITVSPKRLDEAWARVQQ
ncbi:MAG: ATP-dependent RNA helicase HrpA [Blastopirellula sp.]|nr:ATP-dependent RNA helicase HrpA [Blastopirellula sp.]